jgi:hypothetical protein
MTNEKTTTAAAAAVALMSAQVVTTLSAACGDEAKAMKTANDGGKLAANQANELDYLDMVDCSARIAAIKALYKGHLTTPTVSAAFSAALEIFCRDKDVSIKTELAAVSENGLGKLSFTGKPDVIKAGETAVIDPKTEKVVTLSPADAVAKLSDVMLQTVAKAIRDQNGTGNAAGQGRKPKTPVAERQAFLTELAGFLRGTDTGPKIADVLAAHYKADKAAWIDICARVIPGNDDARNAASQELVKAGWAVSRKGAKSNA